MLVYKKNILLQCRRFQRCGKQGYSPDGLERCSHIAEVIGSSPIIPTLSKKVQENKFLFFLNLFYFSRLPGCLFLSTSFDECRSAEHDESHPYHSHFTFPFLEALMRKVYYSLMLFFLALLSLLILSSAVTTYRYLVLPST